VDYYPVSGANRRGRLRDGSELTVSPNARKRPRRHMKDSFLCPRECLQGAGQAQRRYDQSSQGTFHTH
jgi:hypothetical protein